MIAFILIITFLGEGEAGFAFLGVVEVLSLLVLIEVLPPAVPLLLKEGSLALVSLIF